jgi:Fic family protein
MVNLDGTPYLVTPEVADSIGEELRRLEERVHLLRSAGTLTDATMSEYYGEKRFEQVAESNAIEGSPLSVGETQLAVLKGITISGHDPAWSRDAQTLDRALQELTVMARDHTPVDVIQVKKLHELILGERPSAGAFRTQPIRISGSNHHPPKTWHQIMQAMEDWEAWSKQNPAVPALLRAAALHSWLVHIHPFVDGNGRTARAVANLELIRKGYPPIIIRKVKDRDRYIDGLHSSDEGDLGPIISLFHDRLEDALRDLERAAHRAQGYDREVAAIRKAQEIQIAVWNAALALLAEFVNTKLAERLGTALSEGRVFRYENVLVMEDYIKLCTSEPISKSWAFRVECAAPGLPKVSRLAWLGFRSYDIRAAMTNGPAGPSVFWSKPNPGGYPPWTKSTVDAPGAQEFTLVGDQWFLLEPSGRNGRKVSSLEMADVIARGMLGLLSSG